TSSSCYECNATVHFSVRGRWSSGRALRRACAVVGACAGHTPDGGLFRLAAVHVVATLGAALGGDSALSIAWYRRSHQMRLGALAALTLVVCLLGAALVLRLDFGAIVVFMVMAVLVGITMQPRVGLYVLF